MLKTEQLQVHVNLTEESLIRARATLAGAAMSDRTLRQP